MGQKEGNTVNAAMAAIEPDRETGNSKTQKEPPRTSSIEDTSGQEDRHAEISNCEPYTDEGPEEKGPMPIHMLKKTHSSRKRPT
jgi:hypothetical protein